MNPLTRTFNAIGGRIMARSGRVAILGTTGAKSGKRREAPVGALRRPDGSVVIVAGGGKRGWAANLRADPACTLDVKGVRTACMATRLDGADRDAAVAEFVAAMPRVTSAASWGDAFVLRPGSPTATPAADGAAPPATS
jgi:deazaflavin-dependent oxidoreductase (nitroreductase family)